MRKVILLLCCFCFLQLSPSFAQSYPNGKMEYTYDESGNRITRAISVSFQSTSPLPKDSATASTKDSVLLENSNENNATAISMDELIPNVFPNPTNDKVTIDLLYNMGKVIPVNSTIEIYDSKSALIQRVQTNKSREFVELATLPTGVYHLIIKGETRQYTYVIQKN